MVKNRTGSISDKGYEKKERRQFRRTKGKLELRYAVVSSKDGSFVSKSRQAQVEDLSLGGLSFKTDEIVVDGLHISSEETSKGPIRNMLVFQFELPGLSNKIKALCKVIWYEMIERGAKPLYAVGAEFLDLQPEDKEAIKRYIDNITQEEEPLKI